VDVAVAARAAEFHTDEHTAANRTHTTTRTGFIRATDMNRDTTATTRSVPANRTVDARSPQRRRLLQSARLRGRRSQ
jgi:hypothetical protein